MSTFYLRNPTKSYRNWKVARIMLWAVTINDENTTMLEKGLPFWQSLLFFLGMTATPHYRLISVNQDGQPIFGPWGKTVPVGWEDIVNKA
ncbi:MAG: hypothetical protein EBQ80_04160 [Proteobacteria bacterium]|nr:hypothetical protein [Pseudomonadota bacterium]